MPRVRIVVGEFRRRMFGESLVTMLERHDEFDVEPLRDRAHLQASLESDAPTVIILDSGARPADISPKPAHRNVAVIRIGEEGRETQVLLCQIAPEQIRQIAKLVTRCIRAAASLLAPAAQSVRGALARPKGARPA